MATTTTLLFDAGGVLVHPDWARVAATLRGAGIAVDAAALAGQEHLAWKALDTPAIARGSNDGRRARSFLDLVFAGAGVPEAARPAAHAALEGPRRAGRLWVAVPDEVPGALAALAARGLRLGVVSNSNGTVRQKLVEVGLGRWFEVMLDSAEEGIEKPDPAIFHRALERLGERPEHAMFVGDLVNIDVVGARAAGLRPVLMDRAWIRDDADCPRIRSLDALVSLLG